ncbi:MAG: MATE family efflux transporter [Roseburia sp.]|nr:MATE family efflux transporter [Roseburia sp.]
MKGNLTEGSICKTLIRFAVPYFIASFLQAFYGMADLYITGQFNGAASITAVSVGSQIMHMITVILIGLAMGTTVVLGNAAGAGDRKKVSRIIGNSVVLFGVFSVVLMIFLLCFTGGITELMQTPKEASADTFRYLVICFLGIPFIVAYNVISSIFRGMGDSRTPMYFVAAACLVNIILDYIFIGGLGFGAAGAALGTVLSQAVSSVIAFFVIKRRKEVFSFSKKDFVPDTRLIRHMLTVGAPVALQDGLIQVAFLAITMIANSRGLVAATAVGVVEKIISFLFLVPSALLSAVSAITAQNIGARKCQRADRTLVYSLLIAIASGLVLSGFCQIYPQGLVGLFNREAAILEAGCQYLKSYSFDCLFAGIHFCFSGYFCGRGKSYISFIHNIASIVLMRIPGAYFASVYFPESLYPMGWAAPLGSLISAVICVGFFVGVKRRDEG